MSLSPGTHVGEYSVLGLLGVGGMGEVYRARDARLNRDIAIKLLPACLLDDPTARARFQREARAVAALNHPNIVTIHEVGEFEQFPFIAFELVAGETLRQRLARGALPVADALAIAVPLAEGLRHAHESGVVHRDLKPQNIMVRPDGQVKILDFGLGKFVSAPQVSEDVTTMFPSTATEAGVILGTLGYTAPEHLQGRPIDARSDQFAFGAILYELLTGRRAFARETPFQTLSAIVEDDPTPVKSLVPRLPARVTAIVDRCLKKHPDERYPTTAALVDALRGASDKVQSRPVIMRRPSIVAAAVLSILMIAAGVAVSPHWPRSSDTPVQAVPVPKRIVVLSFANVDGEKAGQAFADGMVELLTTRLSGWERRNRGLLVVPTTEVSREEVTNAKDARRAFRATHVVGGSVQRSQGWIRVTLNLTDTATFQIVGGDVIEGDALDAMALQDAVARALARMVGVQVDDSVIRATAAPGAFDYYVQGRGYLQRFERVENVDSAIELFTRAIDRDPTFALGRAALGEAYWRKYELTREPSLVTRASEQVRLAVDRDPNNVSVQISSGVVARGTGAYETAVTRFERALDLDPTNADAHRELGRAYEALKRFDDAERTYRKAIDIRPGDWSAPAALGRFLYSRGRYEEALAQFQRVIDLTPDNAAAHSNIGGILVLLKRAEEARVSLEKSVSIRPTQAALANLGMIHFTDGRYANAAQAFEQSAKLAPNDFRVWANVGSAYQYVPDESKARAAYEKALALATAEFKVDPRRTSLLADLADFYAALGRRADAERYAVRALAAGADDARVLFKIAVVYESLGQRQRALTLLAGAARAGYPIDQIERARSLSDLRADSRYRQAIRPVAKE